MSVNLNRIGRLLTTQNPGELRHIWLVSPYIENGPSIKTRLIGGMGDDEAMIAEVVYEEGGTELYRVWDKDVWNIIQALRTDGASIKYYAVSSRKINKLGETPYYNTFKLMQ